MTTEPAVIVDAVPNTVPAGPPPRPPPPPPPPLAHRCTPARPPQTPRPTAGPEVPDGRPVTTRPGPARATGSRDGRGAGAALGSNVDGQHAARGHAERRGGLATEAARDPVEPSPTGRAVHDRVEARHTGRNDEGVRPHRGERARHRRGPRAAGGRGR